MIRFLFRSVPLILIGLAIAAYFTNPTKDDFNKEVDSRISSELNNHLDLGIEDKDIENFRSLFKSLGDSFVKRDNYYVCSVFTVKLPTGNYKYLGIYKNFLPLQEDNPLHDVFDKKE